MSEVWAVCQNRHPVSEGKQQRYQIVELVSSFNEESGLSVSPLFAIGGFELVKKYSKKEMTQLSHRIPASSILGNGGEVLIGHWKLDSAALPPESSLL